MQIQSFCFNPFQENTYIVFDETKECVIFDPGCYSKQERDQLTKFIADNQLKPVKLINTHCHIDHVFGNNFVADTYKIKLSIHREDLSTLRAVPAYAPTYGFKMDASIEPSSFLEDGDILSFGTTKLKVFFTPGHSPGSISFFHPETETLIVGDVLFNQSIGRTDLPGGNYETLVRSIHTKLFVLPDSTTVYPGHGPTTTIGYEKKHNPFVKL